jgi:hypothetical protein
MNREATEEKTPVLSNSNRKKKKHPMSFCPCTSPTKNIFDPKEKNIRNRQGVKKKIDNLVPQGPK